jgi:hypothetical protein
VTSAPQTSASSSSGTAHPRDDRLVRGERLARQHDPLDVQVRAVRGVDRPGDLALADRGLEVDDHEALLPARGAGEQPPVGVDDEGVAVEDELVLAADAVDVHERGAGLHGAAGGELAAHVVLAPLVRRAVDADDEPGAGGCRDVHRSALLPQVLADDGDDVHPVQPHDRQPVAAHEVAELVEDAVVRQVVLGVAADDPAAVQHGRRVLRLACRTAQRR